MNGSINRLQFLRGDFIAGRDPIHSLWSLPEPEFIEKCNRCGDCVSACECDLKIINVCSFPESEFSKGYCAFYTGHIPVYKRGAISKRVVDDSFLIR